MWRPLRDADLDHLQPVGNSWPACDGGDTEEGTAGPEVKNASSVFFSLHGYFWGFSSVSTIGQIFTSLQRVYL